MTDVENGAQDASGLPQAPQIRILAQFIRDLSFENPRAPDSLRAQGQPAIELGVEMGARGRPDGLFEVDLKLNAVAQQEGQTSFQVELVYGGLFEIQNVSEQDLEPVLLVECPRYLFPFARRIIAEMSSEGGFPPFLLEPLDFGAVYMAQRAQQEAAAASGVVGNA
jgi:preprotein translocase subunit SecB